MLKYSLTDNTLTARPDDCSAQTHSITSLDKEAIIAAILKRGTTLTKTDILAVLNSFEEVVTDALQGGNNINIPLFNTSFSISGVFEGPLDSFDSNRHKLNINLTKGVLLREIERKVKLEKTNNTMPIPQIQEVKDSITITVNDRLSSKGVIEIRGYNLKIEGDNPNCGLWFVMDNGAEYRADVIVENKPSKIIAMVPILPAGTCQVKVVTQSASGGKLLKEPKTFTYPKKLQVEI